MVGFLSILFLASAPDAFQIPHARVRPEVAIRQVKACGFRDVTAKEDQELQEEVLLVSGVTTASTQQLRCVAKASLRTVYFVEFPRSLYAAYQRVFDQLGDEQAKFDARVWLSRQGLLHKLPVYRQGKVDDLLFARKLESLCGPKATGVFVRKSGMVTMDLGTPEKPTIDSGTFVCLTYAANAAGFPLGFVGNEYYQRPSRE